MKDQQACLVHNLSSLKISRPSCVAILSNKIKDFGMCSDEGVLFSI